MQTLNNVHEQFADFFSGTNFRPFASLLSKKLSEGHICLDLRELIGMPGFQRTYQDVQDIEKDLYQERLVSSSPGDIKPFVLHNHQLYLHRYFTYESMILGKIQGFLSIEQENFNQRVALIQDERNFIDSLFPKENTNSLPESEQINWQKLAVLLAVLNNFMIITGGPGTGKTYTVSKILELLKRMDPALKVGLAAPTGKAAMRLAETLQGDVQPVTIHRLLKTVYGTHHFKHNREFPLDYDVIIIDEASMVDVALFAKLMDAIRPDTRLILLGDKDQLASVEAGSMFRDLCQSPHRMNTVSQQTAKVLMSFMDEKEAGFFRPYAEQGVGHILNDHNIELKRSRRFNSQLGIGKFSKAVISGDREALHAYLSPEPNRLPDGESQVKVDTDYSEEVFGNAVSGYEKYIREENTQLALKKFNEFRILCAVREGEYGLYRSNIRAEEVLKEMKLIDPAAEFYCNRPVMLTRNNYDLGLFNGDIGIVRPDSEGQMMLWFSDGDQLKAVPPARLDHIETVYAMTIHKSQGSEYDEVLVMLPRSEESELLTRELLYTAVTRAKKSVSIQAGESALLASVEKSVKRASGIQERLHSLNKDI